VAAGEGHHVAQIVIVHLDLRVHAQQDGAGHAAALFQEGGAGAGGLGEGRRAGAVPAGGQSGQGQGGGQGQGKPFGADVLFHFIHLLEKGVWFVCSAFRLRSRCRKTGAWEKLFSSSSADTGRIRRPVSKTGAAEEIFLRYSSSSRSPSSSPSSSSSPSQSSSSSSRSSPSSRSS